MTRQPHAHKSPHAHRAEVYAPRLELVLFPLLVLAVLVVLVVAGPA